MAKTAGVDRNIYFFKTRYYRLNNIAPADRFVEVFDPTPVFSHIRSLPFSPGSAGRYLPVDEGRELAMQLVDIDEPVIQGYLLYKRSKDMPGVEQDGAVTPLPIPNGAGLAELTHFVLFLDKNIMGVEYNFHGPRPTQIRQYIKEKGKLIFPEMDLEPYAAYDAFEDIENMVRPTSVHVSVRRSTLGVANITNAPEFIDALGSHTNAEVITLSLRVDARNKQRSLNLGDWITRLRTDLAAPHVRENVRGLIVKGEDRRTGSIEPFDLLKDRLIVSKRVVGLTSYRAVDSESMWDAIKAAYLQIYSQLR